MSNNTLWKLGSTVQDNLELLAGMPLPKKKIELAKVKVKKAAVKKVQKYVPAWQRAEKAYEDKIYGDDAEAACNQ